LGDVAPAEVAEADAVDAGGAAPSLPQGLVGVEQMFVVREPLEEREGAELALAKRRPATRPTPLAAREPARVGRRLGVEWLSASTAGSVVQRSRPP
jgi:hypothetical protein